MMIQTNQTPHLELLGLRSEIKAFIGNPKCISSPFLDSLTDDEYFYGIYVTDDTWIIYRDEEMLDEWMDDHPGAAVLDYPGGGKNGCNALMVYDSK